MERSYFLKYIFVYNLCFVHVCGSGVVKREDKEENISRNTTNRNKVEKVAFL